MTDEDAKLVAEAREEAAMLLNAPKYKWLLEKMAEAITRLSAQPTGERVARYQHRSGGTYQWVAEGQREDDRSAVVIYRSEETGIVWVRDAAAFFDGRFTRIEDGVASHAWKPIAAPQAAPVGDERQMFEQWARAQYVNERAFETDSSGRYKYIAVQRDWEVWQARAAHPAQPKS